MCPSLLKNHLDQCFRVKMSEELLGEAVDSTPAKPPTKITIKGNHVTLVPLDLEAHLDQLYQSIAGPENKGLYTYFMSVPYNTKDDFKKLMNVFMVDRRINWVIEDNKSGKIVGLIGFADINPVHRTIEFGPLIFSRDLKRTTGATESSYLLLKYALEDLGYRRVTWKSHSGNTASQRAALRLGFTYEGTLRQEKIVKGHNRDTPMYSIIDQEWTLRKRALEEWLSPNNFDAEGAQRQSLASLNGVVYD